MAARRRRVLRALRAPTAPATSIAVFARRTARRCGPLLTRRVAVPRDVRLLLLRPRIIASSLVVRRLMRVAPAIESRSGRGARSGRIAVKIDRDVFDPSGEEVIADRAVETDGPP